VRFHSSASDEQVRNALQSINAVAGIESIASATDAKIGQWSLQLESSADISTTIAACTEQLVSQAVPVMGIAAEARDLQTLFRNQPDIIQREAGGSPCRMKHRFMTLRSKALTR